jgi:hypothetical protein
VIHFEPDFSEFSRNEPEIHPPNFISSRLLSVNYGKESLDVVVRFLARIGG